MATAAGNGYRFGLGVFTLIIHIITLIGAVVLIVWRRRWQPAKINSRMYYSFTSPHHPFVSLVLTLGRSLSQLS